MSVRALSSGFHVLICSTLASVADVLLHAGVEESWLLAHQPYVSAEPAYGQIAHVVTVHKDL